MSQLQGQFIGAGLNGTVIRQGDQAIKRPRVHEVADVAITKQKKEELEWLMKVSAMKIQNEKMVYQHLGRHHGIIAASYDINSKDPIITMPYERNGTLHDFLLREQPNDHQKFTWAQSLANTVAYCHSKNVLLADIASRNCLLNADFCLILCDFADSAIIAKDVDIITANDYGVTVQTDIARFALVLYEICISTALDKRVQNPDFMEVEDWPRIEDLPPTEKLLFGDIIRNCWLRVYRSMEQVSDDLTRLHDSLIDIPERSSG